MCEIKTYLNLAKSEPKSELGAAMLEYALMAALIAVIAMGAVGSAGSEVSETFNTAGEAMQSDGVTTLPTFPN